MRMKSINSMMLSSAFVVLTGVSSVVASTVVNPTPAPAVEASADKTGPEAPSLKISGYTSVIAAAVNQQEKQNGRGGPLSSFAIPVSDLKFTIGGKTPTGYGYGYVINFKSLPGYSPNINRNYVQFTHNDLGAVQFGAVKGVDDSMTKHAYTLIGGAAGLDGSASGYFNFSEGVYDGVRMVGTPDIATKINWVSPSVSGLKVGFSYTPNTSHVGKSGRDNSMLQSDDGMGNTTAIYPDKKISPYGLNNMVYGVTYEKTWGECLVGLSALAIKENSRFVFNKDVAYGVKAGRTAPLPGNKKIFKTQRSTAYQLSGSLQVKAWEFAGSWMDNGKARLMTKDILELLKYEDVDYKGSYNTQDSYLGTSGTSWNAGTRYTFGAYQAAVGYFQTDRKTDAIRKATLKTVTTTLDFKAAEGLTFFGEVDYIRTKSNDRAVAAAQAYYDGEKNAKVAVKNNSGTVVIVGTKVSF
jgi:hypothetical protein